MNTFIEIRNELHNLHGTGETLINSKHLSNLEKLIALEAIRPRVDELEVKFYEMKRDALEVGDVRDIFTESHIFHKGLQEIKSEVLKNYDVLGNSYIRRPTIPLMVENDFVGILHIVVNNCEPGLNITLNNSNPKLILAAVNNLYTNITGRVYEFAKEDGLLEWLYIRCYAGVKRTLTFNTTRDGNGDVIVFEVR